ASPLDCVEPDSSLDAVNGAGPLAHGPVNLAAGAPFGPEQVTELAIQGTRAYVATINGVFFFFQAEDGIRDLIVTGVQTCALPIWIHVVTANWQYNDDDVDPGPTWKNVGFVDTG